MVWDSHFFQIGRFGNLVNTLFFKHLLTLPFLPGMFFLPSSVPSMSACRKARRTSGAGQHALLYSLLYGTDRGHLLQKTLGGTVCLSGG